jgi:hypothetical protein
MSTSGTFQAPKHSELKDVTNLYLSVCSCIAVKISIEMKAKDAVRNISL